MLSTDASPYGVVFINDHPIGDASHARLSLRKTGISLGVIVRLTDIDNPLYGEHIMTNVKLFDLIVGDFPIDCLFRSLQVFQCFTCNALTNATWWANCFMGGARVDCPNEKEPWHRRIEGLRYTHLFEVRPRVYQDAVEQEVEAILKSVVLKNDLLGEPILDWFAQAVLHDGYVVDGVGCSPRGRKRMAMRSGYFPSASPSFKEEVFQSLRGKYPEEIVPLARIYIQAKYEFASELKGKPRNREVTEAVYQSSGLAEANSKIKLLPEELGKLLDTIHERYREAHWQWEADEHLKVHSYRARQQST